jgi:hypothetical protein
MGHQGVAESALDTRVESAILTPGRFWVEKCLVSMVSGMYRNWSQTVEQINLMENVDTKESFSLQSVSASISGSIICDESAIRIPPSPPIH